jgi:hypothetical protein
MGSVKAKDINGVLACPIDSQSHKAITGCAANTRHDLSLRVQCPALRVFLDGIVLEDHISVAAKDPSRLLPAKTLSSVEVFIDLHPIEGVSLHIEREDSVFEGNANAVHG